MIFIIVGQVTLYFPIASDVGKGVLQGVSQYITKRMRTVKVTLKAGHRVLLHSPEQ